MRYLLILLTLAYASMAAPAHGLSFPSHAHPGAASSQGTIQQDVSARTVTMTDAHRTLMIRLNYNGRCVLDRVVVNGRDVISPNTGVYSGIDVGSHTATTRTGIATPKVRVSGHTVAIGGIAFASRGVSVRERWTFTIEPDGIDWRIRRSYQASGHIDDTIMPGWDFAGTNTWTGGMLNTGGVAWGQLIGRNCTYGAHANAVTFWKPGLRDALRITTTPSPGLNVAARFSQLPSGVFSYVQSAATKDIVTKHGLQRFIDSGTDLWAPVHVQPGDMQVTMRIQAIDYASVYGRGVFKGIDGDATTQLLNTIGRYGVIDRRHVSGNGWVTGFVCLHEPFYGALAAAVDDPDYTSDLASALDDWRDHAMTPAGRVMARWAYSADMDNMVPGTYNPTTGYYDCGWGYLLDAQADYPIDVAEEFDLNGDKAWLRGHKSTCERALDWMLRRDTDGSGLMTMMTDSHTQKKSSDWIDIVYASGKNALVNAEMYDALCLWADKEAILGDAPHEARYRAAAVKLRQAFVRPLSQGGFWDPDKGWFAYWRESDESIHGDNLVTPVNFCAIAYGICSPAQRKSILDHIETRMRQEQLFHWPLCFTSYAPDECRGMMPFPKYENGDIFLSWGELGVRAYADYKPSIAIKYVRLLLDKYRKDGLAYQRYLRVSQVGAGEDILAGNSNTIAGLYRDIYGIQPQWNRLLLDPHLTPDLAGTRLSYRLRGQSYSLQFNVGSSSVTANGVAIRSPGSFAVNCSGNRIACFAADGNEESMGFNRPVRGTLRVAIAQWPDRSHWCRWTETRSGNVTRSRRTVSELRPEAPYRLLIDGRPVSTLRTDDHGSLQIVRPAVKNGVTGFTLVPPPSILTRRRLSAARITATVSSNVAAAGNRMPRVLRSASAFSH